MTSKSKAVTLLGAGTQGTRLAFMVSPSIEAQTSSDEGSGHELLALSTS